MKKPLLRQKPDGTYVIAICEFGDILSVSYKDGKRCRKRATATCKFQRPFGTRITGTGEVQVFAERTEFRCDEHKDDC